ncbi:MAG: rhodanese-like domain-containing protein [Anaerolineae bacterium]
MKAKLLVILLIGLFLITACETDSSSTSDPISAGPINLETLPKSIDVSTAASLTDNDDVVFIDVREQWEYDEGHIPGITLIPMSELENRLAEIPTDKTVVLTCRSGNRSGRMHAYLEDQGFDNTINMEGGILAWEAAGLAVEK